MPPTAKELGINPWNPRESIFAQARYMAWSEKLWTPAAFAGRTETDIFGLRNGTYNWGRGNMLANQKRHGWALYSQAESHLPEETQAYNLCIERGSRK